MAAAGVPVTLREKATAVAGLVRGHDQRQLQNQPLPAHRLIHVVHGGEAPPTLLLLTAEPRQGQSPVATAWGCGIVMCIHMVAADISLSGWMGPPTTCCCCGWVSGVLLELHVIYLWQIICRHDCVGPQSSMPAPLNVTMQSYFLLIGEHLFLFVCVCIYMCG